MSRSPPRYWHRLGLILAGVALAALFLPAAWRSLTRADSWVGEDRPTLRFAHWSLEPGVREAFDALATDYMARHPHVRIEQLAIPGRAWRQWVNTQLVGGMAPDLIAITNYYQTDADLARHFTPLTTWLDQPNPYNAGEPDLADVPWRLTYAAELVPADGVHYYSQNLLEYFGVPNSMVTVRVFYNRDLVREITGRDEPPTTYREFAALCEAIGTYATDHNRPLLPLAGSMFNVTRFTDNLFNNATQNLALTLDPNHDLTFTQTEMLRAFARGEWGLDTPAVRQSLVMVEQLGRHMPSGWMQLDREDSFLQFVQGRAVMLATGTWDAASLIATAPFAVGAFRPPELTAEDPEFGGHALGPVSEANIFASLAFGLTRSSRHPELALDFLRFITSRAGNTRFAADSLRLPVIKGVPVPPAAKSFRPIVDGYPGGINLRTLGGRAHDLLVQNLHLLAGHQADVDAFVAAVAPDYAAVVRDNLRRHARTHHESIRQNDSALVGHWRTTPPAERAHSHFDRLAALQLHLEAQRQESLHTLHDNH